MRYTPAYFQEYIDKDYEVRITFVGDKAFPVKIISQDNIDWRRYNNKVDYKICEIPKEIYDKSIEFMKICDISFGCFDFIIKDDIWYFLEMNANGQWYWLEDILELKISDAIINFLLSDTKNIKESCFLEKVTI